MKSQCSRNAESCGNRPAFIRRLYIGHIPVCSCISTSRAFYVSHWDTFLGQSNHRRRGPFMCPTWQIAKSSSEFASNVLIYKRLAPLEIRTDCWWLPPPKPPFKENNPLSNKIDPSLISSKNPLHYIVHSVILPLTEPDTPLHDAYHVGSFYFCEVYLMNEHNLKDQQPPLSIPEQIENLKELGLVIEDHPLWQIIHVL